ncbi:MAG TPA: hypothetical protein VEB21_04565 [Terriglobales bacterium]|nr:hypothetical protein [Terriglobales bacterium]
MRTTVIATLALGCFLASASCSSSQPVTPAEAAAHAATEAAQLEIPYARTVPKGNHAVLNFSVRNPYKEEVDGIRVVFRVTTSRDPGAPEVTRVQKELAGRVGAGNVQPFEIEVPAEARQRGAGTYLRAYALRRGNEVVPLPPEWQKSPRP